MNPLEEKEQAAIKAVARHFSAMLDSAGGEAADS
jgi:hypothetical protein